MCFHAGQRRAGVSWEASPSTHKVIVHDIIVPLHGAIHPIVVNRLAKVDDIYKNNDSILRLTTGFDTAGLQVAALKTAQALLSAHSKGLVHGNVGLTAFYLDSDSITLLDVGLYGEAQRILDRVQWGPAHHYKARYELTMDPVEPTVAMDVHSWAKTMIALFSRSAYKTSLGSISTPTKPLAMPEPIWNVVKECLDENLTIQIDMEWIVAQLEAVIGQVVI